jgi:DNA processing protein
MSAAADEQAERVARAVLTRIAEPADRSLGTLLGRIGAHRTVELIREGRAEIPGTAAMRIRSSGVDGAAELSAAARSGIRFVCPGESEWPAQLDDLGAARPYGLWVRGPVGWRTALLESVSIVGSRAATGYGVHVATELAAALAEAGWAVVSGCAFGIDVAAHRGALAMSGRTVGVLAGGVDVPYPIAHSALIERIADEGALLSEAAPGAAPARRRFLTRNRIIAACSRGTVVVEAATRSGAATTARWADQLGRVLMAVPGPVTSAVSTGSNELLRSRNAIPVTRAAEVVEAVGSLGVDLAEPRSRQACPGDGLDAGLTVVLEAMPSRRVVPAGVVAKDCGRPETDVLPALGRLSALGLVERVAGGWRMTREARGRGAREPAQTSGRSG